MFEGIRHYGPGYSTSSWVITTPALTESSKSIRYSVAVNFTGRPATVTRRALAVSSGP